MSKYTGLLSNSHIFSYPIICPFLVGVNLPELIGEKRYYHVPILLWFPVFYTGARIGQTYYEYTQKYHIEKEKKRKAQWWLTTEV
jgi:hypothetical protein